MAILQKEALEYQRALFELPRFLFTGITIFSTAASFLAKDKISFVAPKGHIFGCLFVLGMILTFVAFVCAYSVVAHTVDAMRKANSIEEAEANVNEIITGVYRKLSWFGGGSVLYWLVFIVILTVT